MKYRKKPVVVEVIPVKYAIHAAYENWKDLPAWLQSAYERGDVIFCLDYVIVNTPEGNHRGNWDDILIQGVKGEIYPCKPDIFEATYELEESPDREQRDREHSARFGVITPCPNCDGSGKNQYGDCCRIPGHSKECACILCQWKNAYYKLEREHVAKLQVERDRYAALEISAQNLCESRDNLREQQKALVEALTPFAQAWDRLDSAQKRQEYGELRLPSADVKHFRAARAALALVEQSQYPPEP